MFGVLQRAVDCTCCRASFRFCCCKKVFDDPSGGDVVGVGGIAGVVGIAGGVEVGGRPGLSYRSRRLLSPPT